MWCQRETGFRSNSFAPSKDASPKRDQAIDFRFLVYNSASR